MRLRFLNFIGIFVCLLVFASANGIYVGENSLASNTLSTNVYVNTTGIGDLFGLQFDLGYDDSLLEFSSATEGDFFGNGAFFSYEIGSGYVRVFALRNESTGVTGLGNVSHFVFNVKNSGESYLNLSDVIWVNSTITNISVERVDVYTHNSSVDLFYVSSEESGGTTTSGGGSSGGGSSGGSVSVVTPENNSSNESVVSGTNNLVGDVVSEDESEKNESGIKKVEHFVKSESDEKFIYYGFGGLLALVLVFLLHKFRLKREHSVSKY